MEMLMLGIGYLALGATYLFIAFRRKPETGKEGEVLDAEILLLPSGKEVTNLPATQIKQTAAAAKRVLS